MLFTENSLIHVRKVCTLKPPLGHDSATEDISATFSMLVSIMQGFFPCLSSMICSLVLEGVAPEWFCIEIGMQQNFACPVSIIWGSPTPRETREWVVLDLIALRKHYTRRLFLSLKKKSISNLHVLDMPLNELTISISFFPCSFTITDLSDSRRNRKTRR